MNESCGDLKACLGLSVPAVAFRAQTDLGVIVVHVCSSWAFAALGFLVERWLDGADRSYIDGGAYAEQLRRRTPEHGVVGTLAQQICSVPDEGPLVRSQGNCRLIAFTVLQCGVVILLDLGKFVVRRIARAIAVRKVCVVGQELLRVWV